MTSLIKKRLLIHILLLPFYIYAVQEIASIDSTKLETLVLFVWLIVIAPITSYFIYSYKNNVTKKGKWLWHITTTSSALVIGMLFVILDILLLEMIWYVFVFRITILIFWLAVVSFDFADSEK